MTEGAAIAKRALAEVGTSFRLHGRTPGIALDCIGLAALATGVSNSPTDYGLKGEYFLKLSDHMDQLSFVRFAPSVGLHDGDIVVVRCAPGQLHLMIRAADGWVHSHAGLRKVVHMPGASPWPIIALWRKGGK
jgi:murein DD-endopeptidase / murein LD-carboxypeptidase